MDALARGPLPGAYAVPADFRLPFLDGPNPFTPKQLAYFFSSIPGTDVRAAVIQSVLSRSTLRAALMDMTLALGPEWGAGGGFETSPALPKPDTLTVEGGTNQVAAGGGGPLPAAGIHTVMR